MIAVRDDGEFEARAPITMLRISEEAHYHAEDFCSVTARALIGPPGVAVVSVQFVVHREPPYARYPLPRPIKVRELELA